LKIVKEFKEDRIRELQAEKISKLKIFIKEPTFEKDKVFGASEAAGNFSLWIRACVETYDALKIVDPKKK
jgi:dynein heavy chain